MLKTFIYIFIVFATVVVVLCTSVRREEIFPPDHCVTPNGERARCVPLQSCPVLLHSSKQKDKHVDRFLQLSVCNSTASIYCCGSTSNFTDILSESEKKSRREHALTKLLSKKSYCGQQHFDDYFHNENETEISSIDEFPWLVAVKSRQSYYDSQFSCGGVIISHWYILAFKCWYLSGQKKEILLGQYNKSQNVSCINTFHGLEDCTEPTKEIQIVEQISHRDTEFLLLRLAEPVLFSDFIRPICLPLEDDERPKVDDIVVTSSWSRFKGTNKNELIHPQIKDKTNNIVLKNEVCEADNNLYPGEYFAKNLLCTKLQNSSAQCATEESIPVMYQKGMNWFLEAIVVIGCYDTHNLTISERITPEIVNWILENMRD